MEKFQRPQFAAMPYHMLDLWLGAASKVIRANLERAALEVSWEEQQVVFRPRTPLSRDRRGIVHQIFRSSCHPHRTLGVEASGKRDRPIRLAEGRMMLASKTLYVPLLSGLPPGDPVEVERSFQCAPQTHLPGASTARFDRPYLARCSIAGLCESK